MFPGHRLVLERPSRGSNATNMMKAAKTLWDEGGSMHETSHETQAGKRKELARATNACISQKRAGLVLNWRDLVPTAHSSQDQRENLKPTPSQYSKPARRGKPAGCGEPAQRTKPVTVPQRNARPAGTCRRVSLFTNSPLHLLTTLLQYYPTVALRQNETSSRNAQTARKKYTNDDIPGPSGTKGNRTKVFLPMWIESLGTLDDPWDNADLLETAQQLWDDFFPGNPQVLWHKKEPIFSVVRVLSPVPYFFFTLLLVGNAVLL
jgi:hypothetical protein